VRQTSDDTLGIANKINKKMQSSRLNHAFFCSDFPLAFASLPATFDVTSVEQVETN
jgi:hypothetical protein